MEAITECAETAKEKQIMLVVLLSISTINEASESESKSEEEGDHDDNTIFNKQNTTK